MNPDDILRVKIFRKITCHMVHMGFQTRQRGYRYLREAVWFAYNDSEAITCVTKLLYPEVAKVFDTTDKQVERAIRNAIETAWTKDEMKSPLRSFFPDKCGDEDTRPTNTEVIEKLVDRLKNPDKTY